MSQVPELADRGQGRPEAVIDWEAVGTWLSKGANGQECAARLGIHYNTLSRRCELDLNVNFSEYMQQNRAKGDSILKECQFNKAYNGDSTMLIWLGKVRLDQKEAKEETKFSKEDQERMDRFINALENHSSASKICDNTSIKE